MSTTHSVTPAKLFAATGAFLVPVSALSWQSSWPPLTWKHTHFASGDFGQEILVACVLFLLLALVYLAFPRLSGRRMNDTLGHLHFWASMLGLLLVVGLPIVLNLTFHVRPGEPKLDRFFRAFGTSMDSTVWACGALLIAQLILVANVVWSFFKGARFRKAAASELPQSV